MKMKIIAALKYKSFDDYHRPIVRTVIDCRFNQTGDEKYDIEDEYPKDSEFVQTVRSIHWKEDTILIQPHNNDKIQICIPENLVIMWINYEVEDK